jgi:nitrite reductase (NO-forming)
MPPFRSLILAAVAALALGACTTDGGHGGHGQAAAEGARTIEVSASSFSFTPDRIEITAGEEVTIELTSTDEEHDFVIDEADLHLHADPGETATGGLRLDEPGTYTAYCSVAGHREAGMTATVEVTG